MKDFNFQIALGLLLLAIAGLLGINYILPKEKPVVMVLSTFEMEDELGKEWFIIEYLVNGHVEQVNCNSFEQSQEVRKYLGVK